MGIKMKEAKKLRFEMKRKWEKYKGPLTPEKKKEMQEDDERLQKVCKEAMQEWLKEKSGE